MITIPTAILNINFFIHMVYSFYSGDISTYHEFLLCKNVNIKQFDKYKNVENLLYDFNDYLFWQVLYVIFLFILSPLIYNFAKTEQTNRNRNLL